MFTEAKIKKTPNPHWIGWFRSDGVRFRVVAAARLATLGILFLFVLPLREDCFRGHTVKSDLFSADWSSVMRADAFPSCYIVLSLFKLYLI